MQTSQVRRGVICRRQKRDLARCNVDTSAAAEVNAADTDNQDDAVDDTAQRNPNMVRTSRPTLFTFLQRFVVDKIVSHLLIYYN